VLSLLLPLLKINFWQPVAQQSQAIRVLQVVSTGDEFVNNIAVTANKNNWSPEQLYPFAYLLVSLVLFAAMLRTLLLIRALLKKYPVQQIEEVSFINTNHSSTPFSFLKYIFWNCNIDINTTTGSQIFKHEVAHIQQKHTHDKLFVNIVLIFCWSNPFFWLYRKELNMIHEFIADKKAVEDSDTAAFAAMILQAAYPKHQFQLANNFFYSPIKRRLMMLTKNKNPKVNYIGRVMVLPLIVLVFTAFSLKAKSDKKSVTRFNIESNVKDKAGTLPLIDSLYKSVTLLKNKADTFPKTTTDNDAKNKKLIYILDGKEVDEKTLLAISPSDIKIVNVTKDKNTIEKYGEKAKNGVVEVILKKSVVYPEKIKSQDSIITIYNNGYKGRLNWKINNIDIPNKALYILNGKEESEEIAAKITDYDVTDVRVLKGDEARSAYGDKGKNGVVILNTKPGYAVQTWQFDTLKIYSDGKILSDIRKKMFLVVDDKFYPDKILQELVEELGVRQLETILFLSVEKAILKYGDKAKNGAVIITTKKAKEITDSPNAANDLKTTNEEAKICLGNNPGGKIDLDYLKAQKEINVTKGYSFVSATLYFAGNFYGNVVQSQLKSNSLLIVEEYMNKCKNGTTLIFDNVYLKDGNGKIFEMKNPPGFTVVAKTDDKPLIQLAQNP
jgi:hypothetical protein